MVLISCQHTFHGGTNIDYQNSIRVEQDKIQNVKSVKQQKVRQQKFSGILQLPLVVFVKLPGIKSLETD